MIEMLAIVGLMIILKESYIFSGIRNYLISKSVHLLELFECPLCLGFHCGWVIYLLSHQHWYIQEAIVFSLMGSAISLLYYNILKFLSK